MRERGPSRRTFRAAPHARACPPRLLSPARWSVALWRRPLVFRDLGREAGREGWRRGGGGGGEAWRRAIRDPRAKFNAFNLRRRRQRDTYKQFTHPAHARDVDVSCRCTRSPNLKAAARVFAIPFTFLPPSLSPSPTPASLRQRQRLNAAVLGGRRPQRDLRNVRARRSARRSFSTSRSLLNVERARAPASAEQKEVRGGSAASSRAAARAYRHSKPRRALCSVLVRTERQLSPPEDGSSPSSIGRCMVRP